MKNAKKTDLLWGEFRKNYPADAISRAVIRSFRGQGEPLDDMIEEVHLKILESFQDAYLKADIEKMEKFFKTGFLCTIARNHCISEWRKKKHELKAMKIHPETGFSTGNEETLAEQLFESRNVLLEQLKPMEALLLQIVANRAKEEKLKDIFAEVGLSESKGNKILYLGRQKAIKWIHTNLDFRLCKRWRIKKR